MSAKFRALAKPIGSHTDKELEGALAPKKGGSRRRKCFGGERTLKAEPSKTSMAGWACFLQPSVCCYSAWSVVGEGGHAASDMCTADGIGAKKPGPMWDRACKSESTW